MKRVLLKLSGEALAGDKKTGFDEATCIGVANQVKQLVVSLTCLIRRRRLRASFSFGKESCFIYRIFIDSSYKVRCILHQSRI